MTRVRAARIGATLTEVLMAILIMAVGVVSVFTLFPISVLRTIQATQQTNSKIHKLNTAELVKANPALLTQFQNGTQIAGTTVNYQGTWRPNTPYNGSAPPANPPLVVIPTLQAGQLVPIPLIFFYTTSNGTSGTDEPKWNTFGSVVDGSVVWQPLLDPTTSLPLSYVIDPLGYNIAIDDATMPRPDQFGNKTDRITGTATQPVPPNGALLRIHGGAASTLAAMATATLLDSWEQVVTGTPQSANNTSVTFPAAVSLANAGGPITRLVATSTDGQMTTYRMINNIAGQQVNLAEQIPARFPKLAGNPDIGTARIESLTRRYTWFLTVRNNAQGKPDIKCVVVFNRNFGSASEHVYDANFGNANIDIDGDGTNDGTQHGFPPGASYWVKIAWPNTEPDPLLKPGNWLFDAHDVTWYRVQELFEKGTTGGGINYAVLLLDRNVRRQSLPPPSAVGQAILMPGIVEVFNL
ncbi:MAG: hypothetical protein U0992_04145 [Planctomycetaceae bacterium]